MFDEEGDGTEAVGLHQFHRRSSNKTNVGREGRTGREGNRCRTLRIDSRTSNDHSQNSHSTTCVGRVNLLLSRLLSSDFPTVPNAFGSRIQVGQSRIYNCI